MASLEIATEFEALAEPSADAGVEDPQTAARCWLLNGALHLQRGDPVSALQAQVKGLRVLEAAAGLDSETAAELWQGMAEARLLQADAAGAAEAYESARQIYERIGRLETSEGARLLAALGQAQLQLGDAAGALAAWERARAVLESLGGLASEDGVQLLTSLAQARKATGDVEGAVLAVQEARRCQAAAASAPPSQLATPRPGALGAEVLPGGLAPATPASSARPKGDPAVGALMLQHALQEACEVVSASQPNTARRSSRPGSAKSACGEAGRRRDDLQRLLTQYAEERAMMEATRSLESPEGAELLLNIGIVKRLLGDLDGAGAAYAEARRIDELTREPGSASCLPVALGQMSGQPATGYPCWTHAPATPAAADVPAPNHFAAGKPMQAIRQAHRLEAKLARLREEQERDGLVS